jgi:hypothetical protein
MYNRKNIKAKYFKVLNLLNKLMISELSLLSDYKKFLLTNSKQKIFNQINKYKIIINQNVPQDT